jgi:hypothetical protein
VITSSPSDREVDDQRRRGVYDDYVKKPWTEDETRRVDDCRARSMTSTARTYYVLEEATAGNDERTVHVLQSESSTPVHVDISFVVESEGIVSNARDRDDHAPVPVPDLGCA